jgi:hypothetical protein
LRQKKKSFGVGGTPKDFRIVKKDFTASGKRGGEGYRT